MDDVEALTTIVGLLKQLDPDGQRRVLQSVQTFLAIETRGPNRDELSESKPRDSLPNDAIGRFSADRSLTAKEFLRDKMPSSDVERVACLAYFLAHYRDAPHFKTIDVSTLNTEAAQPKFSNASVAVDNATKQGYLVSASKGNKQISAAGERYVELLPDRERARDALTSYRRKPRQKNARKSPNDV